MQKHLAKVFDLTGVRFRAKRRHGTNMRYRSGWCLVDDRPKTMFAMGIHGQNLFIDRANRIVVAKLSSWKQRIDYLPLWATHRGFERLQRTLAQREAALP